jgi:hypothetical protein|tara:strand:- start:201 stop:401 length:201 start_codon:yes stop_codon:yes gene_type:complete
MTITECEQPNSKRPAMVFDSKEEVVTIVTCLKEMLKNNDLIKIEMYDKIEILIEEHIKLYSMFNEK